jgi:hypothetical protein
MLAVVDLVAAEVHGAAERPPEVLVYRVRVMQAELIIQLAIHSQQPVAVEPVGQELQDQDQQVPPAVSVLTLQ